MHIRCTQTTAAILSRYCSQSASTQILELSFIPLDTPKQQHTTGSVNRAPPTGAAAGACCARPSHDDEVLDGRRCGVICAIFGDLASAASLLCSRPLHVSIWRGSSWVWGEPDGPTGEGRRGESFEGRGGGKGRGRQVRSSAADDLKSSPRARIIAAKHKFPGVDRLVKLGNVSPVIPQT